MAKFTLPSVGAEGGLARYLQQIRKFPMLRPDEEYMLAKRWREHDDTDAAHRLVTSHLRLVAKIAMGFRGYGLPLGELISEGNVGMMQAVKRFEPDRGFRLATYAMSWSLVKMGTTAAQKKLFFNLRKLKARLDAFDDGDLAPEIVRQIADKLSVPESDVVSMNGRLAAHDRSLNAPVAGDAGGEWQDWLVDEADDQETVYADREELLMRRRLLKRAMAVLSAREQRILTARRLEDPALTLENLSKEFGVSRERIRQIEVRAFEKVQQAMKKSLARLGERQRKARRDRADASTLLVPGTLLPVRP